MPSSSLHTWSPRLFGRAAVAARVALLLGFTCGPCACGDASVRRGSADVEPADTRHDRVDAPPTDTGSDAPSGDLGADGLDVFLTDSGQPSDLTSAPDTPVEDTAGADTAPDLGPPLPVPGQTVDLGARGVSARWAFVDAYDNVAGGDWYRGQNNEAATLAWGESYVMMALAAMFRATADVRYLERLSMHADSALAQRDDRRGVRDYRGVSGACWRNTSYQSAGEAYCYTVHSGMLGYPMVEFARLVRAYGLEQEPTDDGQTLGVKADGYVQAAREIVAYHDDQYVAAGYYAARPDATFLSFAGRDLPLNQSNAMGRLLLALYEVTGEPAYVAKATGLAQRFKAQLTTGANGEVLWNYWGGPYVAPGEDISHAAINVDFALLAAAQGVVFTSSDIEAFGRTFLGPVYVDDATIADHVGGGATNGSSYRAQLGRWLRLAPHRVAAYAAVRELYEQSYPASGVASGSLLCSWALLAEHEPVHRDAFFYLVDWVDPNPAGEGDWRQASAANANVLTTPPELSEPAVVRLEVDLPRATSVQQWDGAAYHTVLAWRPTSGPATRWVPYEPRWPHVYWNGGVLFQLADAFVAGQGMRVRESTAFTLPAITSTPPAQAAAGQPLAYTPQGSGDGPLWWSLRAFPVGARTDPASGTLSWTPPGRGTYHFELQLQSDFGAEVQGFDVVVP